MRSLRQVVILAATVNLLLGCAPTGLESQVNGTVKLDGKAVGPGTITFALKNASSNPATGAIEKDGSYRLKTARTAGLHPGMYQVSLTVFEAAQGQPGKRLYGPSKMITPEKYSSTGTSGLEYEVKSGGNTINIDLSSK
jgi:hypothetical protein